MNTNGPHKRTLRILAFSLVEVLVVVVILGIVLFLAVPNIVQVRQDSEDNLARSRAEALNVAVAAYFQAAGAQAAATTWAAATPEQRYLLVAPYLAFAPSSLSSYMPAGYSAAFTSEPLRSKVIVSRVAGTNSTPLPY